VTRGSRSRPPCRAAACRRRTRGPRSCRRCPSCRRRAGRSRSSRRRSSLWHRWRWRSWARWSSPRRPPRWWPGWDCPRAGRPRCRFGPRFSWWRRRRDGRLPRAGSHTPRMPRRRRCPPNRERRRGTRAGRCRHPWRVRSRWPCRCRWPAPPAHIRCLTRWPWRSGAFASRSCGCRSSWPSTWMLSAWARSSWAWCWGSCRRWWRRRAWTSWTTSPSACLSTWRDCTDSCCSPARRPWPRCSQCPDLSRQARRQAGRSRCRRAPCCRRPLRPPGMWGWSWCRPSDRPGGSCRTRSPWAGAASHSRWNTGRYLWSWRAPPRWGRGPRPVRRRVPPGWCPRPRACGREPCCGAPWPRRDSPWGRSRRATAAGRWAWPPRRGWGRSRPCWSRWCLRPRCRRRRWRSRWYWGTCWESGPSCTPSPSGWRGTPLWPCAWACGRTARRRGWCCARAAAWWWTRPPSRPWATRPRRGRCPADRRRYGSRSACPRCRRCPWQRSSRLPRGRRSDAAGDSSLRSRCRWRHRRWWARPRGRRLPRCSQAGPPAKRRPAHPTRARRSLREGRWNRARQRGWSLRCACSSAFVPFGF